MSMQPRNLQIMDFIDLDSDEKRIERERFLNEVYSSFAEFTVVHEWYRAQEILADPGHPVRPDLIMFDISFSEDTSVGPGRWAKFGDRKEDLKPIGAILALPFLNGRDIVSAGPYSTIWGDLQTYPEPMLYTSLGLLLAKVNGGPIAWEDLDSAINSIETHTIIEAALFPAVERYRESLSKGIEDGLVTILPGVSRAINEIENIRCTKAGTPTDLLMNSDTFSLRIRFSYGEDCISLTSLFADLLFEYRDGSIPIELLDRISGWLSTANVLEEEWNSAIEVIKYLGKNIDSTLEAKAVKRSPSPLDRSIFSICGEVDHEELSNMRRICIVLAHVIAAHTAYQSGRSVNKSDVYDILGLSARNYMDLFGARTIKKMRRHVPLFRSSSEYHFDEDTVLSRSDLHYAEWYARYILKWQASEQWPAWMRVSINLDNERGL